MEQSVSESIAHTSTAGSDVLGALDWKDGIGTLPGSNIKFCVNEFGMLEIITEAEAEAIKTLSTLAANASLASLAPAAVDAPTASSADLKVPRDVAPCSDFQACRQMDGFENGKFCAQTCSQQYRGSDTRDIPDDCRNRGNSRNHNVSIGCQVNEADRPVKRLRRKRRLLLESEEEQENADEDEEKNKSNNMKGRRNTKPIKQVVPAKKKVWNWSTYLEEERMPAAPLKLFREHQSFPQGRNGFKVGMKLEGLDPEHPSQFCVLTVAEVQGYRMRLHFDGYQECYDFWVNADSSDIHPVGWCEKTNHKLLPPKGFKEGEFNWTSYLKNCKAQAAPKSLFKTLSTPVTPSGFRLGMKLEAVDKKNPSLMGVATITDMLDNRLLIHFDNWNESYDYWCEASSPYIRPVGYCQETGTLLTPPPGYKDPKAFSWEKYLEETNSQAAPARAFKLRPAHGFQVNMKLEAVDRRNPILIRVATIVDKDDRRIKIHFDGWDRNYDFWVDADSPDVHPVGWCAKTGHALQVPLGAVGPVGTVGQTCPTPGCHGIGHVKGPRYGTHYTLVGCPYSDVNLNRENVLQDRLSGERPSPSHSIQKNKRPDTAAPFLGGAGESSQEDSPHSRKSAQGSEKSCQSSLHSLSEQSENNQERDWVEEESSAAIKAKPKKLGCSHAYIKLQLVKPEDDGKDPDFDLQQALHQSIFMPSLSSNPSHRLHLCWEQHCRLLPEVSGLTAKHVAKWTVEEVVSFIQRLPGCKDQAAVFREEQIDGEAFLLLNQTDIVKILGIKLGPALKIYNAILMLKSAEEH
ncbi:lethal(3)malignant brain tumor-like protein 4 isoform X2 [Struthio camelus]|uniref:lethal(3)malignant brain tumor-like protein 4 isoform X2 n=1 Tax=Struthio camelus TaxID=8801 RepID=UPI00051E3217|nr:PREDICTED: lethal(3)malignant brain tumor-like protein 4 isoform X1 [Struthio camelus australis]